MEAVVAISPLCSTGSSTGASFVPAANMLYDQIVMKPSLAGLVGSVPARMPTPPKMARASYDMPLLSSFCGLGMAALASRRF